MSPAGSSGLVKVFVDGRFTGAYAAKDPDLGWVNLPVLGGPTLQQLTEMKRDARTQQVATPSLPKAPAQARNIITFRSLMFRTGSGRCSNCYDFVSQRTTLLDTDFGPKNLYRCDNCDSYLRAA